MILTNRAGYVYNNKGYSSYDEEAANPHICFIFHFLF